MQKTRRQKFTEVYQKNTWNGTESVSGTGSDLAQTARLRQLLPSLMQSLSAASIIDAPCGDLHWMKDVPWENLHIAYTGIDIVPDLVAQLQKSHPTRTFACLDLVADILPKADLILCRDCLVHLPLEEIKTALQNLVRSGSTWLLTTTFPSSGQNTDVKWSGWRPLNLQAPPFNFPPPTQIFEEGCTEESNKYADKSLALWPLKALASSGI